MTHQTKHSNLFTKTIGVLLLAAAWLALPAQDAVPPASPAPHPGTLTNVAALAQSVMEPWDGGAAFDLTATVTCVIPCEQERRFITVADDTGCAFVFMTDTTSDTPCAAGDRIRVTGEIHSIQPGGSRADCTALRILSHGEAPPPVRVSIPDLLRGRHDWQFVRVSGIVRNILISDTNENWVLLTIVAEGGILHASAPRNGMPRESFDDLLGQVVEADGYCNPRDISPRAYLGRIFQCPGRAAFRPRPDASADPFAVPAAATLHYLSPGEIAASGRVRTTGRVLAVWGGRHILLRTPAGNISRADFDHTPPPCGADIEVSGFPETDCFHLTFSHALFRPVPPLAIPEDTVAKATAAEILTGRGSPPPAKTTFHGRPVRLTVKIRNLPDSDIRRGVMLVEDGVDIFPVDVAAAGDTLANLRERAIVEITGICVLQTEDWRPSRFFPQIRGFQIVVNDPGGIRLVAAPPWWTASRLLTVIGTLLAALAGILVWNTALRRLAVRKGRELMREQFRHVKADLRTEERTRLAVELHDTLAQNLTGVSMEIEAASDLRGNAPPAMLAHLTIAAKALKSCRDELRNCLWDLRSQALEEKRMDDAIRRTLQPHVADARLVLRFCVPRARLPDNTAHALLRIIRELVVNATRHGAAATVKVAGSLEGSRILCSVTDDGCGFDPASAPGVLQGHFGLQGIRERIEELGGTFAVESTPGKGTRATLSLTLPKEG